MIRMLVDKNSVLSFSSAAMATFIVVLVDRVCRLSSLGMVGDGVLLAGRSVVACPLSGLEVGIKTAG